MLCWFQVHSKVNQLNIYIYPLFFQIFPPVGHYTVLIQVPCAIKQVMVIYFIYSSVHWRRKWHPTPVLLCGKSHGWRSLVGCSPWGCKNLDTTGWFHLHFSLSCIGEGNGNPLQCSCLQNPRDWGAWWAAIYGVTQSRTRLKRLSSSSSSSVYMSAPTPQFIPPPFTP